MRFTGIRLFSVIALCAIAAVAQPRRIPESLRALPTPRATSLGVLRPDERPRPKGRALAVGVSRKAPAGALARPVSSVTADGRAAISSAITSVGASRLRVHFLDFNAGQGEVWIYGAGGSIAAGPYAGRGLFDSGEFWSGGVEGPTVVITYIAPAGAAAQSFPFRVDVIAHEWISAANGAPLAGPDGAVVASCQEDVSCHADRQELANGVAKLTFVSLDSTSGTYGAYVCTGSILETNAGNRRPYLLTANHCIGSEDEARSLEAIFFYQTAYCNGPDPGTSTLPTVVGAHFLAGADITAGDYSLSLLREDPPAGVTFLKYRAGLDPVGASVFGIHHPRGTFKRYSSGVRTPDAKISVDGAIGYPWAYYAVQWSLGATEGGSSGSPLFDTNDRVVGTLTAGPTTDACSEPRRAFYGRLEAAYPVYAKYLDDATSPLTLSPSPLTFTMTNGVLAEPSRTVTVTTSSSSPLAFTVTANQPWIKVSGNGSAAASAPANITVTLDPAQLPAAGPQNGAITVTPAAGAAATLPVAFEVNATQSTPTLWITPNPIFRDDSSGTALWPITVGIYESSGVLTRITSLKVGGSTISSAAGRNIPPFTWFPFTINFSGVTTPRTVKVVVSGTDVATGRSWQLSKDATFVSTWNGPVLNLTALPGSFKKNPDANAACPWVQTYVVRETNGHPAILSGFTVGSEDHSLTLGRDFGAVRLPANGALVGNICRTAPPYVPIREVAQVSGTDDSGTPVSATATADTLGPAADAPQLTVGPSLTVLTPTGNTGTISVDPGGASWSAVVAGQFGANWLSITSGSGTGAGQIRVTANSAGLANGYYSATVLVYSANTWPQVVPVAVALRVGATAAPPSINAGGIVNAWKVDDHVAPGSLISIWGTNLASAALASQATPFENRLAGTTVTINGVQAPLYYVSPEQLNVQVPFETDPGTAQVVVTVNGQSATAQVQVVANAPGVCTDNTNNKLCGGGPGNNPSGRKGDVLVAYMTGQGALKPAVATGASPFASTTLSNLPVPAADLKVTIGGVNAPIYWAGVPTWSVGVLQVNFTVPDVAPGDQPFVVTVAGQASQTAVFTVNP